MLFHSVCLYSGRVLTTARSRAALENAENCALDTIPAVPSIAGLQLDVVRQVVDLVARRVDRGTSLSLNSDKRINLGVLLLLLPGAQYTAAVGSSASLIEWANVE